ncbi:MAG: hypothetical protein ABIH20_04885 [Candidatus Diapherotrites archaeon]
MIHKVPRKRNGNEHTGNGHNGKGHRGNGGRHKGKIPLIRKNKDEFLASFTLLLGVRDEKIGERRRLEREFAKETDNARKPAIMAKVMGILSDINIMDAKILERIAMVRKVYEIYDPALLKLLEQKEREIKEL